MRKRGKNGKFVRDWRAKMVADMAAASRASIERSHQADAKAKEKK